MENHNFIPIEEREPGRDTGESGLLIEPKPTSSPSEWVEGGRAKFCALLRTTDIRSLVQYLTKAGVKIDELVDVPEPLRIRFASKEFKRLPYTWRNPGLYLLADRFVVELAYAELSARIRSHDPSLEEVLK
jgi:hypothetical protein